MRAYMTTGTVQFLKSMVETNKDKTFQLMKSAGKGLLYYEENKRKASLYQEQQEKSN